MAITLDRFIAELEAAATQSLREGIADIDRQLAELTVSRDRLAQALAILEEGTPAARPRTEAVVDCPDCGRQVKRSGLGPHRKSHTRAAELAAEPAGDTTPTPPPPATSRPDTDSSTGTESTGAGLTEGELAEILTLLEHPEWVEGAVRRDGSTAWTRADGDLWECSCGKRSRLLSQLHQHLRNVVDPRQHRPLIEATTGHAEKEPTGPPVVAANGMVKGLPFGCSCRARFATTRDWADHRKGKPTGERNRHRLVDQPRATMVPTGLPAHPARRDDRVAPHIIQPHAPRVGAL